MQARTHHMQLAFAIFAPSLTRNGGDFDMSAGVDEESVGDRLSSHLFWVIVLVLGAIAMASGSYGQYLENQPSDVLDWLTLPIDVLNDLIQFEDPSETATNELARDFLQTAKLTGGLTFLLLAARVVIWPVITRTMSEQLLKIRSGHEVVFGQGIAANEYMLQPHKREVTQIAEGLETRMARSARLGMAGTLERRVRASAATKARRLIVDEGTDSETWQVAQSAARLVPKADVLAHLSDPWIQEQLARIEVDAGLRPFSYSSGVSRQVMLAHPPFLLAKAMAAPAQHILIIGFGAVGQALLREFLVTSVVPEPARMMVTVFDPNIEELKADFIARHPALMDAIDGAFMASDLRFDSGEGLEFLKKRREIAEICAAYVSINDANMPLSVAVAMKDRAARLDMFRCPIFLCAEHGAGLPRVRHGPGLMSEKRDFDSEARKQLENSSATQSLLCDLKLVSFGSWRDALDGSGLFEPMLDGQAQAFHNSYLKQANPDGFPSDRTRGPSEQDWTQLPDQYRISNRRAAAHIRAKAYAAGFDLAPWLEETSRGRYSHELPPAAEQLGQTTEEFVERMSRLEHQRWTLDRLLNGWRPGDVRDDFRKVHNQLKAFDQLNATEKAKDDTIVRVSEALLRTRNGASGRRKKRR